jgi:hypothetical protein
VVAIHPPLGGCPQDRSDPPTWDTDPDAWAEQVWQAEMLDESEDATRELLRLWLTALRLERISARTGGDPLVAALPRPRS